MAAARKPKSKAERSAFSNKVSQLVREGAAKNPKQAVAIAYSELRKGGARRLRQSHGGKRGARRVTR